MIKLELNHDLETILVCALRYCMDRKTYMPSLVMNYLTPLLPHLKDDTLEAMYREATLAMFYGSSDHSLWKEFRNDISDELERRKEHE